MAACGSGSVVQPELPKTATPRAAPARAPAGATSDMVHVGYGRWQDRKKVLTVDYWIDRTEVTTAAYAACVRADKCAVPTTQNMTPDWIPSCNWGKESRANHPINCVDWNEATAYCAWQGKRLPTDEEWVLAASFNGAYPWGNAAPGNQACWNRPQELGTCAVGSYPAGASHSGALDMAGNVYEWTASKRQDLGLVRSSSWGSPDPRDLRVSFQEVFTRSHRTPILGFRCAR